MSVLPDTRSCRTLPLAPKSLENKDVALSFTLGHFTVHRTSQGTRHIPCEHTASLSLSATFVTTCLLVF